MLTRTCDASQAVFKVNGSLAAILNEKVWEQLLKGEAVGIIEPDPNRWSLYIGGNHVKTYTAGSLRQALNKILREHDINDWLTHGTDKAETRPGAMPHAEVVAGYPYIMCLEPEALARYEAEGMDAKRMSMKMRLQLQEHYQALHSEKKKRNVRAIDILGSQIHVHGMTREGRD